MQYSEDKPVHGHDVTLQYDADGYITCKVNRLTWQDFMTEEQYRSMVKQKAIERGKNAQDFMLHCNNQAIREALYSIASECKAISERA